MSAVERLVKISASVRVLNSRQERPPSLYSKFELTDSHWVSRCLVIKILISELSLSQTVLKENCR